MVKKEIYQSIDYNIIEGFKTVRLYRVDNGVIIYLSPPRKYKLNEDISLPDKGYRDYILIPNSKKVHMSQENHSKPLCYNGSAHAVKTWNKNEVSCERCLNLI